MVFWISLLFVCAPECSFAENTRKFFNAAECRAATEQALKTLKEAGATAAGVCLSVDIRDLT